ncbi:T9SS type A sorting domain-containing protein [Bizionia sp. KMM 8389]
MKKRNSKKFLHKGIFIKGIFLVFSINMMFGQSYPEQVQLPNVTYQNYQQPTTAIPNYLETFTEAISGSFITRVSDQNVMGVSGQRLRHNYSRDQTWNSNETLIKLAGYPAAILDGETYEFLYWSDIPSYGRWSNLQPNIMYGTDGNTFVSHDVNTNSRTVLHRFNEYESVNFGFGEGNQDKNDRYVGLIGRNGNNSTLLVYDIQNDIVTGTKYIGGNGNELDWFSVSQLGGFAVAQYKDNGTGETAGIKSYAINMTNEQHIYHNTEHGDLGVDAHGNEVIVEYGGESEWNANYSLYMARLDGGGVTKLFPYINGRGIWGGHISTQNINRPGWAYISEQCCPNNPVAPSEIFAIKLDDSGIIERYGKHNSAPSSYLHETQVVPNRNGTKMVFASNWNDADVLSQSGSPSFVLEYPQNSQDLMVNAGTDIEICYGESTNLTAYGSGGDQYLWSTGETTQNIEVTPNETTTYTVTLSNSSGASVTDTVTVTVNELPIADAGEDVDIINGETVTLTATGGDSYLWRTNETSASITVSPTETTSYEVQVMRQGCSSEDTVIVSVAPTPITADAGNDVAICYGETITLTASGGSDYVWSTGETSQSITVSPMETQNYIVTVSDGVLSDTDSVMVYVTPLPNANAGTDITITEGASTTLNASGGDSYLWSNGATSSSVTVSPIETTTYSVVVSSGVCAAEDSVIVTVIPEEIVVEASAGEDVTICENTSTILTASGGSAYLWSTGETTQTITVSPSSTTTYYVQVSEDGVSDSASVKVTVTPSPVASVSADVTIESGQNTVLTAAGGASYLWSTGETSSQISVSPNMNTTYTVSVSANGCTDTNSVTVSVVEAVNADAGEDVELCANDASNTETILRASGGLFYEWSTGETTAEIVVSPTETATYEVIVSNGVNSDTDYVNVIITPCLSTDDFNEVSDLEMLVYPNPATQNLQIKVKGVSTEIPIKIYDMLGRLLQSESWQFFNGGTDVKTLDVSRFPRGLILIKALVNNKEITKKILLK